MKHFKQLLDWATIIAAMGSLIVAGISSVLAIKFWIETGVSSQTAFFQFTGFVTVLLVLFFIHAIILYRYVRGLPQYWQEETLSLPASVFAYSWRIAVISFALYISFDIIYTFLFRWGYSGFANSLGAV